MSPRDAWGMTMLEYNEIITVKDRKPSVQTYDKDMQNQIIGRIEVGRLVNG